MNGNKSHLVLETGEIFSGVGIGAVESAGEVVFNTSHSGYEEIATDPSYYSQIIVMTAPMQGNYGENDAFWESKNIWIKAFVCLEMQYSKRDKSWADKLNKCQVPILTEVDTRSIVTHLREQGTTWGAIVHGESKSELLEKAKELIAQQKDQDKDWANIVSVKKAVEFKGEVSSGPRIALIDFGCKENTIRELRRRSSFVKMFPSRVAVRDVEAFKPDAMMLSNGPGDPEDVLGAVDMVKSFIGKIPVFGICMGHQILARAFGANTYKLKYGHRGSNHPIRDSLLSKIYMTSQNHGYAVCPDSLPAGLHVTHKNLNDQTISGIYNPEQRCFSVQFHPESHPGPHESVELFDFFIKLIE